MLQIVDPEERDEIVPVPEYKPKQPITPEMYMKRRKITKGSWYLSQITGEQEAKNECTIYPLQEPEIEGGCSGRREAKMLVKEESNMRNGNEYQATAGLSLEAIDQAIRSEGPFGLAKELEARFPPIRDADFRPSSNAVLMKTRLLLDQRYAQQWHRGRRMHKKPEQM